MGEVPLYAINERYLPLRAKWPVASTILSYGIHTTCGVSNVTPWPPTGVTRN